VVAAKGEKITVQKKILVAIGAIVVLTGVGAGTYYAGLSQREAEVETLKSERQAAERSYATSLENVSAERNRALNDYEAACTEYQLLYVAYSELYEQRGSGLNKYSSPDGARGNEESCYR
jgi:uncharacterized protein HemX